MNIKFYVKDNNEYIPEVKKDYISKRSKEIGKIIEMFKKKKEEFTLETMQDSLEKIVACNHAIAVLDQYFEVEE